MYVRSVRNSGQHSDIVQPFWHFVQPKKFGSDIWLSTNQTNIHFTCADSDVSTLKLTDSCKDKSDATLHYACLL